MIHNAIVFKKNMNSGVANSGVARKSPYAIGINMTAAS
jgi:hypothetical protein